MVTTGERPLVRVVLARPASESDSRPPIRRGLQEAHFGPGRGQLESGGSLPTRQEPACQANVSSLAGELRGRSPPCPRDRTPERRLRPVRLSQIQDGEGRLATGSLSERDQPGLAQCVESSGRPNGVILDSIRNLGNLGSRSPLANDRQWFAKRTGDLEWTWESARLRVCGNRESEKQ
jgi:hypothetical protein